MWRYHFCRNDRSQLWGDYKVNLDRCVTLCFLTLHDQLVIVSTTGYNIKEFYVLTPGVFLGAFAKLRQATIIFIASIRPSVRMEQLGSHWTDFYGSLFLSIFQKKCRENLSLIKIGKEYRFFLDKDQYTFLATSLSVLCRMNKFRAIDVKNIENPFYVQ